jgi:hypothetical protein
VTPALAAWLAVVSAVAVYGCTLSGCTGRFESRTQIPPMLMGPRDAGAPPVDARSSTPLPDAWSPMPLPDAGSRADAFCDPGDERSSAVYFGSREDTTLMLTPGQVLAIARVELGGGLCSGLVIAPRWVLTAAHCAGGSGTVSVGADPDRLEHSLRVRRAITHPSLDLMLLELASDATAEVPGLTPVAVYGASLTGLVGRTGEAAGYGQREDGRSGDRRFTAERIVGVSREYISIDGEGRRGVCFGDSGGPLMIREGGQVYVLGALSNGDPSCVGVDNYARVDEGRPWIESNVGPLEPPADPCMGETLAGRCEGATAIWCESSVIRRRECGRCGQRCGNVAGVGGAYCL